MRRRRESGRPAPHLPAQRLSHAPGHAVAQVAVRVGDLVVDELADAAFVTTPTGVLRLDKAGRSAALYLRKGKMLGLPQGEHDRLIIDDEGRPVAPGGLKDFLRRSRSVRMNILFNTSFCQGLFQTRYGSGQQQAVGAGDEGEEL